MQRSKLELKSLTLDEARQQFQLWRAEKSSGDKIPESLWKLVSQLLATTHYKRSALAKTLGISTRQLRNKFPGQYPTKSPFVSPIPNSKPFVQVPLDAISSPLLVSPSTLPQLTIECNKGVRLTLSSMTDAQFALLLKTFME